MSLLSWISGIFSKTVSARPTAPAEEHAPRHERREAGRERHHRTGEPAWEKSDRLDEPPGAGKKDPDAAPEILGS